MSLGIIGFGFLPLILGVAEVNAKTLWPAASAIHAIYLALVAAYRLRQTMGLANREPNLRSRARVPAFAIFGASFAALVLQTTNALWMHAPWPYLPAIVLLVLAAFTVFMTLLWQLWVAA